jgi:hypothetical protein
MDDVIIPREIIAWNIGQLSKQDVRDLDKRVKLGELHKAKLPWPWIAMGACIKTCWYVA